MKIKVERQGPIFRPYGPAFKPAKEVARVEFKFPPDDPRPTTFLRREELQELFDALGEDVEWSNGVKLLKNTTPDR